MRSKSIKRSVLCFMLCLAILVGFAPLNKASASSTFVGRYYRINYQTTNYQGDVIVNYTVLEDMSSALANAYHPEVIAHFSDAYRNSLPSITRSLNTTRGTYTVNLGDINPCNATGWVTIDFRMMVGYYFDWETAAHVFCRSYTGVETYSHEVSAAEAVGTFAVRTLPGLYITFQPATKAIKYIGLASTILGISGDFAETINLLDSCPSIKAGFYISVSNWYTADGKLNVRYKVWQDINRYNRGDLPVFDAITNVFTFPQ